jgi:hypothetical protein
MDWSDAFSIFYRHVSTGHEKDLENLGITIESSLRIGGKGKKEEGRGRGINKKK